MAQLVYSDAGNPEDGRPHAVSRPLRFLHLTTFYPPYSFGGDAMYIYRLAHTLAGLGHEVDVIHNVDAYRLHHPGPPEIAFAEHPRVRRRVRAGSGRGGHEAGERVRLFAGAASEWELAFSQ